MATLQDMGECPSDWFISHCEEYAQQENRKLIIPFEDISKVSVQLLEKYKAHELDRRTWMIAMDVANKEFKNYQQ